MERNNYWSFAVKSYWPHKSVVSQEVWHRRLGHAGGSVLQKLQPNTEGVEFTDPKISEDMHRQCKECRLNVAEQQISRSPAFRGEAPFDKVHIDLIEMPEADNSESIILHFYCAYVQFHIVYCMKGKKKTELYPCIRDALGKIKNWGFRTRYLHLDDESALQANVREWQELITENGLIVERTPKGNKEANGGAESSGKRIVRVSRAMMIESGLPRTLWPHFVDAAAFILNRTPVKRLQWKTPYEMVFGRQPNLAGLRIPGSLAYVRRHDLPGQMLSKNNLKVENNAVIGYYIGPVGSNIYNIWIPSLERVVRTRDAIIDEQKKFNPAEVVPKESPYAPSGVTLLQVEVTEPVEVPVRAQKPESSKAQDSFNPYPTPVSSMDSTPILTPRTGTPALSEACEQLEAKECE